MKFFCFENRKSRLPRLRFGQIASYRVNLICENVKTDFEKNDLRNETLRFECEVSREFELFCNEIYLGEMDLFIVFVNFFFVFTRVLIL